MKKLFLLLATGCFAFSAIAQESTSVLFSPTPTRFLEKPNYPLHQVSTEVMDAQANYLRAHHNTTSSLERTTSSPFSDWYDMWAANYNSGTAVGYYWTIYPDSNIYDNYIAPGGTAPDVYTFWEGMGQSFDPTDSNYYYNSFSSTTGYVTDPIIGYNQAYYVDSFGFFFRYVRSNPTTTVVDSLIIEMSRTQVGAPGTGSGATPDSGDYILGFQPSAAFIPIAYDSTARTGLMRFDRNVWPANPNTGDCLDSNSIPGKVRIAIALTNTSNLDTVSGTGGLLYFQNTTQLGTALGFPIDPFAPTTAVVGPNLNVYVYFKSGVNYPLGTDLATAGNAIEMFAGEPQGASGWWMQSSANSTTGYPGSVSDGVMSSSQIGYSDTGFQFNGHDILIPSYAYAGNASSVGYDVPEFAFHINYSSLSVGNVNNTTINTVNAYPNPASDVVNIGYKLSQTSNVTITLSNMMGKVVAKQTANNVLNGSAQFNTNTLADGLYIYTVESNGERSTGRVEVIH